MATTETTYHVKWSGADSIAVNDAANVEETSDAINAVGSSGATVVAAAVTMKVDLTAGTGAAGDIVEFYLARSMGDPDGDPDVTFEYPTDSITDETITTTHLASFDFGDGDTQIKTVSLPVPMGKVKLYVLATALDSGDSVSCSAVIRAILG